MVKVLLKPRLMRRIYIGLWQVPHHIPSDPLAGIEVLLASGAIYALGDLYLLSGEEIF